MSFQFLIETSIIYFELVTLPGIEDLKETGVDVKDKKKILRYKALVPGKLIKIIFLLLAFLFYIITNNSNEMI